MASSKDKNELGQFTFGNKGNPEGKNGHTPGWQPFSKRARKILSETTAEDIMLTVIDPKRFNKLSSLDAAIYQRTAEALKSSGKDDMKFLIEYTDGKPDAKLNVTHAGKFTFGQESVSEINSWISGFTGRQEDTVPEDTEQE